MKVTLNSIVSIAYKLTDNANNNEIEKTPSDRIMKFKFGINELLPKFEENLIGLKAGDNFDFTVASNDAYGPIDKYAFFDIPKDTFMVDGKIDDKMLLVGNSIPMTDNQGNKHIGQITLVMEDAITMNFNHPLAGVELRFVGEILEVHE